MESELEAMAANDVLSRYDDVRDVRIQPQYQNETYKHVLLPVYTTAYTYKGKKYHVMINGQSGSVEGDYPKSPAKIAGIVAAVLLALALLFWFSEGKDMMKSALRQEVQTEYACLYTEDMENEKEERSWDYSADSSPM